MVETLRAKPANSFLDIYRSGSVRVFSIVKIVGSFQMFTISFCNLGRNNKPKADTTKSSYYTDFIIHADSVLHTDSLALLDNLNGLASLINGLSRLINGWEARAGPWGRRSPPNPPIT